jgi:AcrR family transcriptional regulator
MSGACSSAGLLSRGCVVSARRGSTVSGRVSRGRARSRRRVAAVSPRVQVSEIQRARLLGAAVAVFEERGYTGTTVAHITSRARVSRRTFYSLFDNREDCLLAVLEDTVGLIAGELEAAGLGGLSWRERVRRGLWVILCFFDREPVLARVCVVQSARGGRRVLECRQEILVRLVAILDEGRCEGARAREVPLLAGEGLVGAVTSIIYSRLSFSGWGDAPPVVALGGLLGELMGLIVLPYLGPAAARRERARPMPAAPGALVSHRAPSGVRVLARGDDDPLREVPMRLTYRTARVLVDVAEHPGVSNRVLAEHVGISDQGQASKLLARLQRLGLLRNTGEGHARGEANAWRLTGLGERVTRQLALNTETREDTV